MSKTQFRLQEVHDILLDRIHLNAELATGKMSRYVLDKGTIKRGENDGAIFIRFRLYLETDPQEKSEFVVTLRDETFFLRGEIWEDEGDDECSAFRGNGSLILVWDGDYDSLYLYLDARRS